MWPFGSSSNTNAPSEERKETREYLESLADYFESVLQEDLSIPVERSTEILEDHVCILQAYAVLVCIGAARDNPNVKSHLAANFEHETPTKEVLKPRLEKWASAAHSDEREKEMCSRGKKAVLSGGSYREGAEQAMEFFLETVNDDLEDYARVSSKVQEAEVELLKAIDQHDSNRAHQTWIYDKIAIQEAQQLSRNVVRQMRRYWIRNYQIVTVNRSLSKYEEAVVGIFYLSSLQRFYRAADEGAAHLGTACLSTKRRLEELPESKNLEALSFLIRNGIAEERTAAQAVVSWAIAHARGRSYKWGDDWTMVDYDERKSLQAVLEDALHFHRSHEI